MAAPYIVTANKQNLLGLVQTACNELAIRAPSQVFGATDNQTIQLLALANREGKEFYNQGQRIGGWQILRKQYVFSLVGNTPYTGTTTAGSTLIQNVTPNPTTLVTSLNSAISWGLLSTNVPWDAHITAVTSNSITLDTAASSSGTDTGMSIGQDGYPFPTDFAYYQTMTSWDRSFRWQMLGPLEAQEWQVLKSGISPTGPRRRFRIMQGLWYVDPVPTASETIVFEYFSNAWAQSSGAAAQTTFLADTDYYTLDDDSFIMGLKWRWKAAKGLDYTQEKQDYDMLKERLQSANGANRDLPLNAQASGIRLLNEQNVPDTGYGS
jgi:hypothetical protein